MSELVECPKDYTKYLDIPSVGAKKKRDALNDLQLGKLKELAQSGFPWADTALMLCYTGFRVSEFLGLTRFSYNFKEKYLQGGLKTDAGKNRIVPVHPIIAPYLRLWLSKGGDRIICNETGGEISTHVYRVEFSKVAAAIGAPEATPHWCRHTFATLLHNAGADPMTTKWLLPRISRSMAYAHNAFIRSASLLIDDWDRPASSSSSRSDCQSSRPTSRILRPANRDTRLFHAALWLRIEAGFSLRYSRSFQPSNTCPTVMDSLSAAGAVPAERDLLYSSSASWASVSADDKM